LVTGQTGRGTDGPRAWCMLGDYDQAVALRAKLGLDPRSEAELASSRAQATLDSFDIEGLRARGREVIELRGHG